MITTQEELVTLIKKTVNKRAKFALNKRTQKEELVNEAYIYVMENRHRLAKFKHDPAHERAYIVSMVRTAITKFYIALDVVKLPPIKHRRNSLHIIDAETPKFETTADDKEIESEYSRAVKNIEADYQGKEKSEEVELWKDFFDDAFTELSNVETYIIENRYYLEDVAKRKTLRELAEELHVTRERVFQLEESALNKLLNYYVQNSNPNEAQSFEPKLIS